MGEPKDAVFERKARRAVWERYKAKAKECQDLLNLLAQAQSSIDQLKFALAEQAEIVDLAERIISDGTVEPADAAEPTQPSP